MNSGSLVMDYLQKMPDKGVIELIGYPKCGMTSILQSMCKANPEKIFFYISPHQTPTNFSDNVVFTNVGLAETLINVVAKHIQQGNIDCVIIDTIADITSEKEINAIVNNGIETLDLATTANILFTGVKVLRELCMQHEATLVIGNIRKTRIKGKAENQYVSENPRSSAQTADKFVQHRRMLEVATYRTTENGRKMQVDHWITTKEQKGLPIPIIYGEVRHDYEKLYYLKSRGLISIVDGKISYNGLEFLQSEILKCLDNTYEELGDHLCQKLKKD